MMWYTYNDRGEYVQPRYYDDVGKSQDQIVAEVMEAIRYSDYVGIIMGTGTGKTLVAANIAAAFTSPTPGRSIDERTRSYILVPTNALGSQYQKELQEKFRLIVNGIQLSVATYFGKDNYICPLDKRPTSQAKCQLTTNIGKKMSCPMYKPLVSEDIFNMLSKATKIMGIPYDCIGGRCYYITRVPGCPYYDNLFRVISSNIVVTNPYKYTVEHDAGVLPKSQIAIIDEFDSVLLSMITMERINLSIINEIATKYKAFSLVGYRDVLSAINNSANPADVYTSYTGFMRDILNMLYADFRTCVETANNPTNCLSIYEKIREIKFKLMSIENTINQRVVRVGSTYYVFGFRNLRTYMPYKVVFMSATKLPDSVLMDLGIDNIMWIEGPRKIRGRVYVVFPSTVVAAYKNELISDSVLLTQYASALAESIMMAHRYWPPTLVHVVAYWIFNNHIIRGMINKYINVDEIIDRDGTKILELRDGARDIVISAYAVRGIDLSNDRTRSIVIPKLPIPDLEYIQAISKVFHTSQSQLIRWYAKVNTYQAISRAVRGNDDWAVVISPDIRVYTVIRELEQEGLIDVKWGEAPKPRDEKLVQELIERYGVVAVDGHVQFNMSEELKKAIYNMQINSDDVYSNDGNDSGSNNSASDNNQLQIDQAGVSGIKEGVGGEASNSDGQTVRVM